MKKPTGADLIAKERERQINEEGYTAEHDDDHTDGSIALAACTYTVPEDYMDRQFGFWPWDKIQWKPTPDDRIRELTKAGALIAAEIDRLLRLEEE